MRMKRSLIVVLGILVSLAWVIPMPASAATLSLFKGDGRTGQGTPFEITAQGYGSGTGLLLLDGKLVFLTCVEFVLSHRPMPRKGMGGTLYASGKAIGERAVYRVKAIDNGLGGNDQLGVSFGGTTYGRCRAEGVPTQKLMLGQLVMASVDK
jgi:hypothetical protein